MQEEQNTHPFNGLLSRTTWVSWYQKGKSSLDLNEARDVGIFGWQWNKLGHMQTICTSLQTDNHINTGGCSSRRTTDSVKALRARRTKLEMFFLLLARIRPTLFFWLAAASPQTSSDYRTLIGSHTLGVTVTLTHNSVSMRSVSADDVIVTSRDTVLRHDYMSL